jgi:hypothetical protein
MARCLQFIGSFCSNIRDWSSNNITQHLIAVLLSNDRLIDLLTDVRLPLNSTEELNELERTLADDDYFVQQLMSTVGLGLTQLTLCFVSGSALVFPVVSRVPTFMES